MKRVDLQVASRAKVVLQQQPHEGLQQAVELVTQGIEAKNLGTLASHARSLARLFDMEVYEVGNDPFV